MVESSAASLAVGSGGRTTPGCALRRLQRAVNGPVDVVHPLRPDRRQSPRARAGRVGWPLGCRPGAVAQPVRAEDS